MVVRTKKELAGIRAAGRLAGEVLQEIGRAIRPGMTTGELDALAARLIAERGARSAFLGYRGFPGNICVSVNEEVVHGIGGGRVLQPGDLVSIDVGVIYHGFIGDTAATFVVGSCGPRERLLVEVTREALYRGIAQARAGNRVVDISRAIQECVEQAGFSVVREFVGHGVGRKVHEEPQIPNYVSDGVSPKLVPGMVLAIEPMVNMGAAEVRVLSDGWTVVTADGLPSAHFEHTVIVTDDGPEILTWVDSGLSKQWPQ